MHLWSVAQFQSSALGGFAAAPTHPEQMTGIGQLTRGAFRINDLLWNPCYRRPIFIDFWNALFSYKYAQFLWTLFFSRSDMTHNTYSGKMMISILCVIVVSCPTCTKNLERTLMFISRLTIWPERSKIDQVIGQYINKTEGTSLCDHKFTTNQFMNLKTQQFLILATLNFIFLISSILSQKFRTHIKQIFKLCSPGNRMYQKITQDF